MSKKDYKCKYTKVCECYYDGREVCEKKNRPITGLKFLDKIFRRTRKCTYEMDYGGELEAVLGLKSLFKQKPTIDGEIPTPEQTTTLIDLMEQAYQGRLFNAMNRSEDIGSN